MVKESMSNMGVRISSRVPIANRTKLMRSTPSSSWALTQSEIAMSEGTRLTEEIEFRLRQNPYLNYFDAKKQSIEYAKYFADRLIWC
jgi:hypothetical protein